MDGNDGRDFDQRRAWLDELMSRPHLWPGQVETVKLLAQELGVEVRFYQLDLNEPAKGWREVERR